MQALIATGKIMEQRKDDRVSMGDALHPCSGQEADAIAQPWWMLG